MRCAVALLAWSLAGVASAQGSTPPPVFPQGVPRMDTAAAQFAYARGVKGSMIGREGDDRARRRALAVDAYRAVYEQHPRARSLGAEAAFRAGELLRAGERRREALVEFGKASSLGADTPFRARARLEIGHVHRREGRRRWALDAYLAVAADSRAAAEHRDDAWLWAGCTWRDLGRVLDARRVWMSVAREARSPLDRILAFDHLAETWIDAGDLEAAAGVLHECVIAHSELALEETRTGERVRKALLRMRAVSGLQRAIERRESVECENTRKSGSVHDRPHRALVPADDTTLRSKMTSSAPESERGDAQHGSSSRKGTPRKP